MAITSRTFSRHCNPFGKMGWVVAVVLAAAYVVLTVSPKRELGISQETGLAGAKAGFEPHSIWHQSWIFSHFRRGASFNGGTSGIAISRPRKAMMMSYNPGAGATDADAQDRKLVRTASLVLVVKSPGQISEKIVQITRHAAGFVEASQVGGDLDAPRASLTIRVPDANFEEVRAQIATLAVREESQGIEAQDMTKQYVDQQARLRKLHAEEQQYLGILRKAATVKDTVEVSEKLDEVRAAIEERQAEFAALLKQTETVAMNITLRAEAEMQVFGLHWRPLYQLKRAARDGLDGLGDYAASMTAVAFYLPTILLWLLTILSAAALGWRVLLWAAKILFSRPKTHPDRSPVIS